MSAAITSSNCTINGNYGIFIINTRKTTSVTSTTTTLTTISKIIITTNHRIITLINSKSIRK